MSSDFKPEYRRGLEDGIELCLAEVERSVLKQDAIERLRYILGLVKESKLNSLQDVIGAVRASP